MKTYNEKNADWIKPNVWLINRKYDGRPRKLSRFDRLLKQIRDNPEMTESEREVMIERLRR